jgi:hypothetical protein
LLPFVGVNISQYFEGSYCIVRLQVSSAMLLRIQVFQDVTQMFCVPIYSTFIFKQFKKTVLELHDSEEEGTMIVQNDRNYTLSDTASLPR